MAAFTEKQIKIRDAHNNALWAQQNYDALSVNLRELRAQMREMELNVDRARQNATKMQDEFFKALEEIE